MQLNFLKLTRQPSIRVLQVMSVVIMVFLVFSVTAWGSGIGQRDIFVGASARAVGMGSAFTAGPRCNQRISLEPFFAGIYGWGRSKYGGHAAFGESIRAGAGILSRRESAYFRSNE